MICCQLEATCYGRMKKKREIYDNIDRAERSRQFSSQQPDIWRAALREGAWRQAEARSLLGAKGDGCERGRTDEEDDGEVELE